MYEEVGHSIYFSHSQSRSLSLPLQSHSRSVAATATSTSITLSLPVCLRCRLAVELSLFIVYSSLLFFVSFSLFNIHPRHMSRQFCSSFSVTRRYGFTIIKNLNLFNRPVGSPIVWVSCQLSFFVICNETTKFL